MTELSLFLTLSHTVVPTVRPFFSLRRLHWATSVHDKTRTIYRLNTLISYINLQKVINKVKAVIVILEMNASEFRDSLGGYLQVWKKKWYMKMCKNQRPH